MKKYLCLSTAFVMLAAGAAMACDTKCKSSEKSKNATTVSIGDKACPHGQGDCSNCKANGSDCCGKCDKSAKTVSAGQKACPHGPIDANKSATTVSVKSSGCSKSAKTVATKGAGCGSKCDKSAKTVATAGQGCSKSAKTVATKDSPCCDKSGKAAKTVATKGAGCGSKCDKSAKTVATAGQGCSKSAKAATFTGGCHKSFAKTVLASMPSMTYRVGDMETPCSKTAAAKSKESNTATQYVVAGKNYTEKGEAVVALTSLLQERADAMSSVQYVVAGESFGCPMTAKSVAKKTDAKTTYRLAGVNFDSKDAADKAATRVADAVAKLVIQPMSEGKPAGCVASCKKAGKTVTYVVAGEETPCETTAGLMLAQAKIRTIAETAAAPL